MEPLIGRTLGRYTLCFELASGGMGTVYLARAPLGPDFSKVVAIKSIHPHLARDRRLVSMFLDEARIASRIGHPNVCTVFDFGEHDGTYFLAMEYLMGEPLSELLRRAVARDDPPKTRIGIAARLVASACEGLHAAHELRDENGEPLEVVHRDVSPQNLFVTYDGTLEVLDFGVASARRRLEETTDGGGLKGKLGYMAPEQLAGARADRRSDIWSLGVVLWELLTLERLFGGESAAARIDAVRARPIPAPSEVQRAVPPALDAVVRRALTRDPSGRYATALEMGRDLHAFLSSGAVVAGPSEVAAWVEGLVPGGRQAHELLVRRSAELVRAPSGVPPRARLARALPAGLVVLGACLGFAIGLRDGAAAVPAEAPRPRAAEAASTSTGVPERAAGAARGEPTAGVAIPSTPDAAAVAAGPRVDAGAVGARPDETRSRRTRPRRAAVRQVGSGAVAIATPGGWADVYVGGRRVGRAPGRFDLPSGRHVLEVRPFGQAPAHRRAVRVRPGRVARLSIPIE